MKKIVFLSVLLSLLMPTCLTPKLQGALVADFIQTYAPGKAKPAGLFAALAEAIEEQEEEDSDSS